MNLKKLNILLADDDEDDREFFRNALGQLKAHCELTMVNDGRKLIDFFGKTTILPDYVFLDINMPLVDGMECLKHIKQIHPQHTFPVIMLSTAYSDEMTSKCYANGASLYIRKPAKYTELLDILQFCIPELKYQAAKPKLIIHQE